MVRAYAEGECVESPDAMKNLVGQSFALADERYRIVDVRAVQGDALIYAEPLARAVSRPALAGLARSRTAFRYGDIAALLERAAD